MTDLDVSLRLRLQYEGRNADKAERDLKDLDKAAKQLGRTKGGDALGKDLAQLGDKAQHAKGKIGEVERETDKLRSALGRVDNGAFEGLKADATNTRAAISGIGAEAKDLRRTLATVDDNGLRGLKGDAAAAEQAIRQIGQAADATEQKLRGLRTNGGHAAYGTGGHVPAGRMGSGFANAAEGAVDQFGLPLAIGAGGAYLAGAVPAGAVVAAGATINAAAGDEERSSYLRVTGGYNEKERRRYDEMMGRVGAKHGIGTSGAQAIFGALQAGGLSAEDAAAMMDNAAVFSKATQASAEDAANTTVALRNNMGITADQMPAAYDAIGAGGKAGQFEVKDMARNLPSILALAGARGSAGLDGVRLAVAIGQSVRKRKGSSDEATTSIEAMLNDINSATTVEHAKKMGVDLDAIGEKASAAGKDPLLERLRALRAIGLDPKKSREVFTNQTAMEGYSAVFADFDEILSLMKEMEKAKGTIRKDYGIASDNFNSQKDRLTSNIGKNLKDVAKPILPLLTRIMRDAANGIENTRNEETRKQAWDQLFGTFFPKEVSDEKRATAYQQYGQTRAEGERGAPSALKRFFLGDAAQNGFNLKEQLGINLRPSAEKSMSDYNDALTSQGAKAQGIAQSIADSIKAMLGFTVSPTISPTYIPAGTPTGGTVEKHTSLQTTTGVRLTQNITSPNAKHAAGAAARATRREIQKAQARTLYDTGRRLA
jgi:TP901 family phage tail tape measure protein